MMAIDDDNENADDNDDDGMAMDMACSRR